MKPLVIYHGNSESPCSDGFGSAFIAHKVLGDEAEYVGIQHKQYKYNAQDRCIISESKEIYYEDREVYILDFSFPPNILMDIRESSSSFIWIDHHERSFNDFLGEDYLTPERQTFCKVSSDEYILLDNTKSGAYLTWEYFFSNKKVPLFIKHIDDQDRYIFKYEETKSFNRALWSYGPWTFDAWNALFERYEKDYLGFRYDFISEGDALLREHERNVEQVIKACTTPCHIIKTKPVEGGEHWQHEILLNVKGLAANCNSHLASDVATLLAEQSGTFGLCWYKMNDGQIKCSFRSASDFNVNSLANHFGGGGHARAAGLVISQSTLNNWIK